VEPGLTNEHLLLRLDRPRRVRYRSRMR